MEANPRRVFSGRTNSEPDILTLLWLAGVLFTLARLARGWWMTRRWAARTLSGETHSGLHAIYLALPAELRRGVALRLTDDLDVPTLVGVLRPQIWLPRRLCATLGPSELRHVLLHELGHARRHDLLCQWLCSLACCLHWFNPLVWLLGRVARTDRELACDAWVLAQGALEAETAASYGLTLLKVVEGMCRGTPRALPAVSMAAGRRYLALRVHEIGAFRPLAPWRGGVAFAAMLALVTALTVKGAAVGSDTSTAGSSPPTAAASPLPSPAPVSGSPDPALPALRADDPSTPLPQVEIESKFVEVSKSAMLELVKSVPLSSPISSVVQQMASWYTADSASAPGGIFSSSLVLPDNFELLARQLNQLKGVDLLSAPRVTTKSGQKATVEITREFLYPTAYERSRDPTGRLQVKPTNFEKTNTGVSLEVNPTLASTRDIIDLAIGWKLKSFDGFTGDDAKPATTEAAGGVAKFPVFTTHSVDAVVSLYSGATVVFSMDGRHFDVQKSIQPAADQEQRQAAPKKFEEDRLLLIFITVHLIDASPGTPASPEGTGDRPKSPGTSVEYRGFEQADKPVSLPADTPYGVPVPTKPGFVTSPYAPKAGYVDVHGYTRGQVVRDPYTDKMFLIP